MGLSKERPLANEEEEGRSRPSNKVKSAAVPSTAAAAVGCWGGRFKPSGMLNSSSSVPE